MSNTLEFKRIRRQCMCLAIVLNLEKMLETAKILVGVVKAQILGGREQITLMQMLQSKQCTAVPQRNLARAVKPL